MKEFLITAFISCFILGCNVPEKRVIALEQVKVEEAPEWSQVFYRKNGWFGGDGIFFLPKTGKEFTKASSSELQWILFSDTMIGDIEGDSLKPGYEMVNNSIALNVGGDPSPDSTQFFIKKDEQSQNTTLFVPQLPDTREGEYYWLGDGFVDPESGMTHIFAYRVINRPDLEIFQFEVFGGCLISFPTESEFPFEDQSQLELKFQNQNQTEQTIGLYGAGIYVNTKSAGAPDPDGYAYIYGVKQPDKQMLVARVKPSHISDVEQWRFYDGSNWVTEANKAVTITDNVSNELSVTPLENGQYLLVSQVGGIMKSEVGIRIGDTPYGPFGPTQIIWDCKEALEEPEFFPYNAKAHPTISPKDELLISYNVNSFNFWEQVESYPHLYRPRFISIDLESLYKKEE